MLTSLPGLAPASAARTPSNMPTNRRTAASLDVPGATTHTVSRYVRGEVAEGSSSRWNRSSAGGSGSFVTLGGGARAGGGRRFDGAGGGAQSGTRTGGGGCRTGRRADAPGPAGPGRTAVAHPDRLHR